MKKSLIKMRLILLLWALLSFTVANAQYEKVDSLEKVLKSHTLADTTTVNTLNELAYTIYQQDASKARAYADRSGKISDQIHYLKGKAGSLWVIGLTSLRKDKKMALDYFQKALVTAEKGGDKVGVCNYLIAIANVEKGLGNIHKANEHFSRATQIAKELQDLRLIVKLLYNTSEEQLNKGNASEAIKQLQEAISLLNKTNEKQLLASTHIRLASIYYRQGSYPASLEHNLSALQLHEQINNESGIFFNLVNIAGIQSTQKDFDTALKTIQRAFLLSKNRGDSLNMSVCLTNIGNIYLEMKRPDALLYFQKALTLGKDRNINQSVNILTNMGSIYTERKNYDAALENFEKALVLAQKINSKYACGEVWIKMGILHYAQKQYSQTIDCTQKALTLAEEIGYIELQKDCHKLLSDVFSDTGSFKNAYLSYIHYKSLSDSLFNEKNTREITILESKYKYAKEKQDYEIEKVRQEIKIKVQKQIILFLVIASILTLLLAFAIYWSNKLKKKILVLEIENINRDLEANQKAMTAATLKLIQNAERDTYCVKMLENIKKNTAEEGQNDIRALISEYKLKSYNSNWQEFDILFEKVNTSFYEKLNERFPTLTTNERRLCAFLKLNMSNNHIVQITFQSEEALKKARLRLRKKMMIDRDTNLATFIQNL